MENQNQDQNYNFEEVVETLANMFGDVLTKEVILTVVESCEGDLTLSAEAIVNITGDGNTMKPPITATNKDNLPKNENLNQEVSSSATPDFSSNMNMPMLYSGKTGSLGAVPKQPSRPYRPTPAKVSFWTDQLRRILTYHNQGSRILILMRGIPGSGKTYLGRQIVDVTVGATFDHHKCHIFSTDDFFIVRGSYQYDRSRLTEAHDWNQERVSHALRDGLSPVIVDNTNVTTWEMEPYVRAGVENGYFIEVVEPNTPWAKKAQQLFNKNSHNVPIMTITRMLDAYEDNITGDNLITKYGLQYPCNNTPPILRAYPPVADVIHRSPASDYNITQIQDNKRTISEQQNVTASLRNNLGLNLNSDDLSQDAGGEFTNAGSESNDQQLFTDTIISEASTNKPREEVLHVRYIEAHQKLEEMEKVEDEWEKGESWEEKMAQNTATYVGEKSECSLNPKPQRDSPRTHTEIVSNPQDSLLESLPQCEDWRQISLFMKPWDDVNVTKGAEITKMDIETRSVSTCVEMYDTAMPNPNNYKLITASPRDINIFHLPIYVEKIPQNRMLHKSTMTNKSLILEKVRCKNEEHHFIAFRKLFKQVPKLALRDVFDKCGGDVNWATDIVLESIKCKPKYAIDQNISESEDENVDECDCLADYHIIPDTEIDDGVQPFLEPPPNIPSNSHIENGTAPLKKNKIVPSEASILLKRQIENNVVISDNHYSQHSLKIRKIRRGELDQSTPEAKMDEYLESSTNDVYADISAVEDLSNENQCNGDGEESIVGLDEVESTVTMNFGPEFLAQLDSLFGRKGMTYPQNVVPKISIPISMLTEIDALWMESVMFQLDEEDKQTERMVKEDEEFARQLEMKHAELSLAGKEPEVPNFKEIMDMEFALSVHQKEVAEWRNNEPNDLAAKMTRDKLYELFEDISREVLSEVLLAHDYNFEATVEVLLTSTGNGHILKEKNGLNKFIMNKEIKHKRRILAENSRASLDEEWPLLPMGQNIPMSVVDKYRNEADMHLARRNHNYAKAQDYIRRGMLDVADYYSVIAAFHKKQYEQANSKAVVSLVQAHARNSPSTATIDLHYLRVPEAKEFLDLFLDNRIQNLNQNITTGRRFQDLFIITGRGLHSPKGPRIKPAVKTRVFQRGLRHVERNPGLLAVRVYANSPLSTDLAPRG